MRFIMMALVGALFSPTAFAQSGQRAIRMEPAAAKQAQESAFHATAYLASLPEGRQALEEYHRMKEAGLLPRGGSAKQSYEVGARVAFSVRNFNTNSYETIDFTLKKDLARHTIWVETALLDGTVTDQHVNSLDVALGQSTPSGSFDSSNGIIENNEIIFGDPPDRDGDSKTDILLLDIRDDPSQGFVVLGFFDSRDLGLTGNNRDIIYLDTNPGLSAPDIILATAAHEYQHLIMAAYDGAEHIFVNEAQSEWAELMNGYDGRNMAFLSADGEHGQDFFAFREEIGGIPDRERGQLFTLYLSERYSPQITGALTRHAARGEVGYSGTEVLGSLDAFRELVTDFHVANLLNDTSLGAKYGYNNQFYTGVRTTVDRTIDGRLAAGVEPTDLSMKGGSVYYIEFTDVTDLSFDIDINSTNPSTILAQRPYVVVRALVGDESSGLVEQEYALNGSPITFAGPVERIRLVIVNSRAQAQIVSPIPVQYSATWSGGTTSVIESVVYDNGTTTGDFTNFVNLEMVMMTKFPVPAGDEVSLDRVSLAPYYLSQFSSSQIPTTAPRDLDLLVLEGTNGFPDLNKEIFSMTVVDPRPFTEPSSALNHFELDLSGHSAELSNLPAEVFVGYADAGSDENLTIVGPAAYSVENISFLGDRATNGWSELWDASPNCCDQSVLPIRVNFLVTTILDVDQDTEPLVATLSQNYPNPFSNRTVIEFSVPNPDHVEMSLYDLLGRRVATLTNETYAPGKHRVTLDGASLAAGVYLLRMKTGTTETTRTLIRL